MSGWWARARRRIRATRTPEGTRTMDWKMHWKMTFDVADALDTALEDADAAGLLADLDGYGIARVALAAKLVAELNNLGWLLVPGEIEHYAICPNCSHHIGPSLG